MAKRRVLKTVLELADTTLPHCGALLLMPNDFERAYDRLGHCELVCDHEGQHAFAAVSGNKFHHETSPTIVEWSDG